MAKRAVKDAKTIRIACTGAGTIPLDELINFQGNLKLLSDDSYKKLRLSVLELGFSFPVQAWKNKHRVYIIDAHQRIATLKRMRDEEQYFIPDLPVSWIEASTKEEAAKKVLAATSQYGEVTPDGLNEFITNFKIDMDQLAASFEFPEIDLDSFRKAYFGTPEKVEFEAKTGSTELNEGDFKDFAHTCPKCGFGFGDKK